MELKISKLKAIHRIDHEIREQMNIQHNDDYFALEIDDTQNKQILQKELKAIDDVFQTNKELLEKNFTLEEISVLKIIYIERAALWYKLRREGIKKFGLENIDRLKQIESEPLVRNKLDSFKNSVHRLVLDQDEKLRKNVETVERYMVLQKTKDFIEDYYVKNYHHFVHDKYFDYSNIRTVIVLPEKEATVKEKTKAEKDKVKVKNHDLER